MCPFFQFVSGWSLFLIFRLESLCFRSQVSVPNYLSFPFSWFQISLSFPFCHFPCLVLRFFLDRIQNLCFPSRRTWYGVQQSRRISPTFITWLKFCLFSFLLRKPSKTWCETSKIKNFRDWCVGNRKINWFRGRRQLSTFCFKRTMFVWVEPPPPPNEHIH